MFSNIYNLYYNGETNNRATLVVNVNDLFLTRRNFDTISWLKRKPHVKFDIIDLKQISKYLRVEFKFLSLNIFLS